LHHELDELVVVDTSIAVLVGLADHLVNLIIAQLLADRGHDVAQLSGGDETVVITVEDLEGLTDLLLGVGVLHLTGHHGQELGEIDGTVVIGIDLVDHILQLRLGGVLAEGAHDGAKLLGGDFSIAILVKEGEGLLVLGNLLFGQRIGLDRCDGAVSQQTGQQRLSRRVRGRALRGGRLSILGCRMDESDEGGKKQRMV